MLQMSKKNSHFHPKVANFKFASLWCPHPTVDDHPRPPPLSKYKYKHDHKYKYVNWGKQKYISRQSLVRYRSLYIGYFSRTKILLKIRSLVKEERLDGPIFWNIEFTFSILWVIRSKYFTGCEKNYIAWSTNAILLSMIKSYIQGCVSLQRFLNSMQYIFSNHSKILVRDFHSENWHCTSLG